MQQLERGACLDPLTCTIRIPNERGDFNLVHRKTEVCARIAEVGILPAARVSAAEADALATPPRWFTVPASRLSKSP